MKIAHPNTEQRDRDIIEDVGFTDHDDRVGTGPHAQHVDEAVAQ